MNKSELSGRLAMRMRMSKTAVRDAVEGVFDATGEALASGDALRSARFGTRKRPVRIRRKPRTGEAVEIAASKVPEFKPGKPLREGVSTGGASSEPVAEDVVLEMLAMTGALKR